jgi:hypothetical protein
MSGRGFDLTSAARGAADIWISGFNGVTRFVCAGSFANPPS